MHSIINKLKIRKHSSDRSSLGSNSSLFNSGTISLFPYTVNEKALPSFLKAVWKNDLNKTKKLMKKNYKQVDNEKRSGLHLACAAGLFDIIKELISNYGNEILEMRDINGKTPLFKSVERGIYENVQYLIEKGAKTDVRDDKDESLIHAAIRYKHDHILKDLLKKDFNYKDTNQEGMTPLHLAAELNFEDGMRLLLQFPKNINAISKSEKTALMIAAEAGFENIVKLLLENKADKHIADRKGYDALYYATYHGRTECVELLKDVEDINHLNSSPKRTVTLEAPEFLASINNEYSQSQKSNQVCENSEDENKRKTSKYEATKPEIKKMESRSRDSICSTSSWIGEFASISSGITLPKSIAMNDISTPSSMPNPSDIIVMNSQSIASGAYNPKIRKQISEDEESQWSSHIDSLQPQVLKIEEKISEENNKKQFCNDGSKASDSEWDSDDTEHQNVQIELSTIDEESTAKRDFFNLSKNPKLFVDKEITKDQDSSELSLLMRPNRNEDGNLTDSNIDECYNDNYIVTNPPIVYDSNDNLSIDEDTDTDALNQTSIINIEKSNIQISKPPKSPSVKTTDNNIPKITVEDFTNKKRLKNLAEGDNLSYSSTEFDINSRHGSLADSDSLNDFKKSKLKSVEEYIKRCSQLESKLRSLESEKDCFQFNINTLKESKDKSETERLKLLNENQKLETELSEKMDELSEFKSRCTGAEEQLKKREEELFEIKKVKQEVEDKSNQLEINNVTLNSKLKQMREEMDYLKSASVKEISKKQEDADDQSAYWIRTIEELKTEIANLQKQINAKEKEFSSATAQQNLTKENFEQQIESMKMQAEKEKEDKKTLQEEIDQLRKTIKNLNSDLESSNKSMALVSKQERENNTLKTYIQEMETKLSHMILEKERDGQQFEKKQYFDLQDKPNPYSNYHQELIHLDRENIQLKEMLKEEKQKSQLIQEKDKSLSVQLRNEIKKKKQVSEIIDSVKYWLDKYGRMMGLPVHGFEHQVSSSKDDVEQVYSSIPNECSMLFQTLTDANNDLKVKLKQSEQEVMELKNAKLSIDKSQEIINENSQYLLNQQLVELTKMIENQRLNREKLEKVRDEDEHQLRSDLYHIKQRSSTEISQLTNKLTMTEDERNSLTEQNKILNETLMKERQLKDSLTEQLINLVKSSNMSNQNLYGLEPTYPLMNGFASNFSLNSFDNERKTFANSVLNLSVSKSFGLEDEELRQKLRQELDRSIARHLENGKPIRQLNIKEKIRSLNVGRQPLWKSP